MKLDYTLAKYIRLSSEDFDIGEKDKIESNSVGNQRDLLDDFIHKTPEFDGCEILEFCDDGRSGTNFDRPGVQSMLEKAKRGEVDCIIVKDLSRFGRNYIEVGDYLEQIFPAWGVRFISVNDMFDSGRYFGTTGGIDIAFRNLVYDIYSRDISDKVRSARHSKAKNGEFISPYAFYGYVKAKDDRHRLVIDEDAANVVRRIFNMAESGISCADIAKKLNADNVPTPQMRQRQHNNNRKWHMNGERNFWDKGRIGLILRDERYTGKLISCKQRRVEIGKVKSRLLPESEWIVVPDALPPIISTEQYARVREKTQRGEAGPKKTPGQGLLFYRKIKCGVCKRAMPRGNYRDKMVSYVCNSHRNIEGLSCTDEKIPESEIERVVLAAIRQQAMFAEQAKKRADLRVAALQPDEALYGEKVRDLKAAIKKAEHCKLAEYEEYREGRVNRDKYMEAADKHTLAIAEYESRIAEFEAEIDKIRHERGRENIFVERFRGHTGIHKLTRAIVDELVKAIYVYDSSRIEIIWNYADEYAELLARMCEEEDHAQYEEKAVLCGPV